MKDIKIKQKGKLKKARYIKDMKPNETAWATYWEFIYDEKCNVVGFRNEVQLGPEKFGTWDVKITRGGASSTNEYLIDFDHVSRKVGRKLAPITKELILERSSREEHA